MLAKVSGAVRFKEPLSFHTSLRIGGRADFFVLPRDVDDLRFSLAFADRQGLPVTVIGAGNNVLIADVPISGMVLKLGGTLGRAEFHGDEVTVGAGMTISGLIREAAFHNLGGLECLAGIPASIGAAVLTNAGTRDGSLADLCTAVYFLYPDGTLGEHRAMAHMASLSDVPPGVIVVGCRLKLARRPMREVLKNVQQRVRQRRSFQPFAMASAGYIWKNPPGQLAERLIDASGLRGKRINGAEISTKCSNLIVNRGGARARDVVALMDLTRRRVEKRFGVTLCPEIRAVGFRPSVEAGRTAELVAGRAS